MRRRAVVLGLVAWVALTSSAVAASGPWTVEKTPNPSGAAYSTLSGVSCASQRSCMAVGQFNKTSGPYRPLAERWSGGKWSLKRTITPTGATSTSLSGVSCPSVADCIAVGAYQTGPTNLPLVERWNGKKWSLQDAPSPAGAANAGLASVSCVSARQCMAVGSYQNGSDILTLAERWNGKKWSLVHTPNPTGATASYLDSVSCVSSRACAAVGEYLGPSGARIVAQRWNGKKWSLVHAPNPSGTSFSQLSGVSCTGASACSAVGSYEKKPGAARTLAERWNGKKWSIQQTVNPTSEPNKFLTSVSCTSAHACTAAGYTAGVVVWDAMLVERWDGHKWSAEKTPRPGTDSELEGVSCSSANSCTAVGWYDHGKGPVKTLAIRR
jgi:hypothetical protein